MTLKTNYILAVLALGLVPIYAQTVPAEPAEPTAPAAKTDKLDALTAFTERMGEIEINGADSSFSQESLKWTGDVHFKSTDIECFADSAEYVVETGKIHLNGNVSVYKQGMVYRGSKANYDTKTKELDVNGMKSSLEPKAPLFYTTQSMNTTQGEDGNPKKVEAFDMDITTHDSSDPNFFLRAKDVTIYPEDRVVFRNLKAYIGDTPVFWLPYLSQPLDDEMGYTFTPGYRSNLGAFLLNQYGDTIGDHSLIKYKLDAYSSRGVALGLDVTSRRHRASEHFGKFKFYWINDANPQETFAGNAKLREGMDPNRYRLNLQHRVYLPGPEESDMYIDVDLNKLSDQFFYEDFFPWEFREDPQPDNMINAVKRFENSEVSLMIRAHLNDFYASDSRLPELSWDLARQPLFGTGLFYGGTSSFGILREDLGGPNVDRLKERIDKIESVLAGNATDSQGNEVSLQTLANTATLQEGDRFDIDNANDLLTQLKGMADESKFNRFHSFHELSYPISVEGKFTMTPKVGAGFTNYSSVSGPKPLNTSRGLLSAGLDLSTKFSKVYDGVSGLGLDSLRHTVQPYMSWSMVRADDMGENFRGIDRLVNSTQVRPIDPLNWTAVDSLRDWNLVRLGVANRFQTKRNDGNYTWLRTNTYFDTYIDDPEFERDFSNLYTDVEWQPYNWTRLSMGVQLPIFGGDQAFTEVTSRAAFMPNQNWEVSLGYRLLQDHPYFQNSNLVDLHNYWKINDNWGISSYQRMEIEDSTLELQQYSIHRDLSSWAMALGGIIRDNRGETEYGLVFSLTLKEFPGVRIPIDFDPSGGGGRTTRP